MAVHKMHHKVKHQTAWNFLVVHPVEIFLFTLDLSIIPAFVVPLHYSKYLVLGGFFSILKLICSKYEEGPKKPEFWCNLGTVEIFGVLTVDGVTRSYEELFGHICNITAHFFPFWQALSASSSFLKIDDCQGHATRGVDLASYVDVRIFVEVNFDLMIVVNNLVNIFCE